MSKEVPKGMVVVKCSGCGSEYLAPNIGVKYKMEDCPVCKQVNEGVQSILKEIGGN